MKACHSSLVLVLLMHIVLLCGWSDAQERPSLFLEKFDNSTSFRSNVCDRQKAVLNNTLEIPDALEGLTLSVVVTNYTGRDNAPLFALDRNGRIPRDRPGLFVVIMDEVARRADFNWRDRFGVAKPLIPEEDGDKTWTDILLWGVESFDISLEKWGYSLGRLEKQISFPAGYWDSSVVLIEQFAQGTNTETQVSWWGFIQPFAASTWVAIAVAILITAWQFWYMERLNPNKHFLSLEYEPMGSLYLAATSFTGHFLYQPHSYSGYVLSVSTTFCALTVAIAYTANMASFLVAPTVTVFNYPSLAVVNQEGARLCVQANGVLQTLLMERFPTLKFSPQDSEEAIFTELRPGGECDVAGHQNNAFRIFERVKEVNYDCSLASNGEVVIPIPAGMATKVDNGAPLGKCTSLISHVLDFHLNEMIEDGFVENAFADFLSRSGEIQCIDKTEVTSSGLEENPFALGLKDVGGLFLFHCLITLMALGMGVFHYLFHPQMEKVKAAFNASINMEFMGESFQDSAETRWSQLRNPHRAASIASLKPKPTSNLAKKRASKILRKERRFSNKGSKPFSKASSKRSSHRSKQTDKHPDDLAFDMFSITSDDDELSI